METHIAAHTVVNETSTKSLLPRNNPHRRERGGKVNLLDILSHQAIQLFG